MKKFMRVIRLCGPAALILWACAIPVGEDFTLPRDTDRNGITIVDYNLQNYVPVPVTGERAVTKVTTRGDLVADVSWKDQNGSALEAPYAFLANTVYQAKIEITPQEGYFFRPDISFAYHWGKIEDQEDDLGSPTRTVTVIYNNSDDGAFTFVTDYNLQHYLPIPVSGEDPKWIIDTEELSGVVTWKQGDTTLNKADAPKFQAGYVYAADITLKTRTGYLFRSARDFKYPDNMVTTQPDSNQGNITERTLSTVTYQVTKEPVTDLDLSGYIPGPAAGQTPYTAGFTSTNNQYTADGVAWKPDVTTFVAEREYKATVVLNAEAAYVFPRAPEFTHNPHSLLRITENTGSSVTVEITFPVDTITVVVTGPM